MEMMAVGVRRSVGEILRLSRDLLLWLSGRKYNIVRRIINTRKEPIQLYWWQDYNNGIHNFGDEITRDIILRLFGYRSVLADINNAKVAGAGSILEIVGERTSRTPIHIWGSGFIMPPSKKRPYDELGFIFRAVRGEVTRNRISKDKQSATLGDPGLLASLVYPRAVHKFDKIGVVVHYAESELPIVQVIKSDPRFLLINPLDKPELVAVDITSCKLVLSSSLHGLIFADSYNVPNIHIQLSERVTGGDYKFKDYYSATGRDYSIMDTADIFNNVALSGVTTNYKSVKNLKNIQKGLVAAFPDDPY